MNTSRLRATTRRRLGIVAISASVPLALGMLALAPSGAAQASVSVTLATTAPAVTYGYYMSASSTSALNTEAYNDGYAFAQNNPNASIRYLILDFGCVLPNAETYDFGDLTLNNTDIQNALEQAVDGAHAGYKTGQIIVTYGNNNSCPTSYSNYYSAGEYQESRTGDVANYISSKGWTSQLGAAAASDMEPSFDTWADTSGLVNGVNDGSVGGVAGEYDFIDYGSADGCPTSGSSGNCNNGWTVADVADASYGGDLDFSLPEIYSETLAEQWKVVANNYGSGYNFLGVTGYSAADGPGEWIDLYDLDSNVGRDLAVF
jgi:hypothetical protein